MPRPRHHKLSYIERLKSICKGKVQIVFAGKAHPNDEGGKQLIKDVVSNASKLFGEVKVVYLENYNIWLGKLITSGVSCIFSVLFFFAK